MQQPDRDVWKRVHLVVADLPQMSATPLKDRLEAIESICKGNSYLTPLKREPLPSVDYLHEMVDNGCVVLLWNKDAAYKSSDTFIVEVNNKNRQFYVQLPQLTYPLETIYCRGDFRLPT